MNNRIKELRKALGLSQRGFGNKLGITGASVSRLEKGERNPSDQTIKSICREFSVNYAWLMEGLGDMFLDLPETLLDELVVEYDLTEPDKDFLVKYLSLSKSQREIFLLLINGGFLNRKGE